LIGVEEGLKHESSIHCDELVSLSKSILTKLCGKSLPKKIDLLNHALQIALDIPI